MELTGTEATLLDRALDIVVVIDEAGRLQYANAAIERVLGYDPESIRGQNVLELIHPEDREEVVSVFDRIVAGDVDEPPMPPAEYRYLAADGSWVWLAARMSPHPVSGSDGYVVSCRDVSARRAAERDRRRVHQRLLDITEHANDVLWMFSPDWDEVLFINSAYESVWGRSVDRLESDPTDFLKGVHPADRDDVRRAMRRLTAGEPVDAEYRVDASNGYRTWVWVQGYPITDADGTVTCVVGFARDVTDRRERERQLLVMDRLLRHNLRNDMNVILGHAEQARESGSPAVATEMDRIAETAEDLLRTVDKERDVVALLTGEDDRTAVDLVAVVEDACARARDRYPRATVETTLPPAATVRAVPKLSLAVDELLSNAVEHAESDAPTVAVTVTADSGDADDAAVVLSVADECPPIPAQEIRVLRGERDVRSVYHGSGLGLWLVHWAVDRSGGDLEFATAERGNTVSVALSPATE
jgi:PAS domain S-box-containing protein